MKLGLNDKTGLMDISKITADGKRLIVTGTILGSVPVRAVLTATEARKALSMMSFKTKLAAIWILLAR
jgi:hypothetical protein